MKVANMLETVCNFCMHNDTEVKECLRFHENTLQEVYIDVRYHNIPSWGHLPHMFKVDPMLYIQSN